MRAVKLALTLAFALAHAGAAQVRGVVVDPSGVPVPEAAVEAWSGLRRIADARSDAAGRFVVAHDGADRATGLVVRRIGFERLTVALGAADTTLRLTLQPAPVVLEGIAATADSHFCPNRDDPRARALWEAMRSKYTLVGDTMSFHSLGTFRRASLPRDEIDGVDTAVGSRGWTAASTLAWNVWRQRIRSQGYAVPLQGGLDERYASWWYIPLELESSEHFLEPLFGELHHLSVLRSTGGETVVGFCPRTRTRGRPAVEGTLTLSGDVLLLSAAWKYHTPGPREDAGAEVDFLPPGVTTHSLLLPETSLYWRRTTGGRFFVERRTYEEWRLSPGRHAPPPPDEIRVPASRPSGTLPARDRALQ